MATEARASNGLDVPDAGAVQVGRGGAWVALANDPLAAYMNPAAMSFQPHGLHLGAHLMFSSSCFTRLGEDGQPVSPGNSIAGPGADGGPDAATCTDGVFPNPQLAGSFRLTDRLALGIAVLGPHAVGVVDWPEEVEYDRNGTTRTQPAPNRYLLVSQQAILIYPTLSVSYAVTPELSFGAGFIWGIASADFTTFTESTSTTPQDDFTRDVKVNLTTSDAFVPGFVLSTAWRMNKYLDMGAWYHWSDSISAKTKLDLTSLYWATGGGKSDKPCPDGDPECNHTVAEDAGTIDFAIPMEAKLGVRFHLPLTTVEAWPAWAEREGYVRDPLSQDRFDVEVDLTWANNSALDAIHIRNKPGIAVKGTPGTIPENGDIPHEWSDVLGIRVGSDVTVLPNVLSLRAGTFFESKGQRDELLNLDFDLGWKAGVSGGGTVRLWPVDISLAFQHVFYGTMDNGGKGVIRALSGDATGGYRSLQTVNGGKLEASLNEVALGATLRF
jgi:long-chain fatty acid transport protein